MFGIILALMAFLSIGMLAIMGVAIGWWLLPVVIIVLLAKSVIKAVTKMIEAGKAKDMVVMSRSEFEKNYTQKPASTEAK